MNKLTFILAGALALLAATAGGYRFGTGKWPGASAPMMSDTAPMAIPDAPMAAAEPAGERKIKFYRNPMGLPDTSPEPKKDWMGMDYIPVYEGDEEDDGTSVKVSLDKIQRAGVRSESAVMRKLVRPVSAPGVAKPDETTLRIVSLRADAFIEKLYVDQTGRHVTAGEPMFRVYSPQILRALIDDRSGSFEGHIKDDQRLEILGVPPNVIAEARQGKRPPSAFDYPAPASGVVMEKMAVEGMMMKMGEPLYRLADLSNIWVIANVSEQDVGQIKIGAPAKVTFRAFPGEIFDGQVTFVLHELDMSTRTAKARIEVKNPDHRIKHEMYADVEIDAGAGDAMRLAVPLSAVLDTGTRQAVLVDKGEGRFEPRPVKLGVRGDGYVEVKDGIAVGDKVVTTANFLIDAESNLKAALKGFTADAPAPAGAMPLPNPMADPMKPANGSAEKSP